jgi:DNA-binding protein H-NS
MCAMRLILTAAALLVFVGCNDTRVTILEQRLSQLEEKVRKVESEQSNKRESESANREQLETCVQNATAAYNEDLIRNGTKNSKGYSVPIPLMNQIENQKREKIDECKLLYSK